MDRAIDAVARTMTEGSPADDLRRRVLARIEADRAPRASWRAAWVLSPLAAAAAIVMAIFVTRGLQHEVRLEPDATIAVATPDTQVRLKPDATIAVATPDTQVRLKPDATIAVATPDTQVRMKSDTTAPVDGPIAIMRTATNRAGATRVTAVSGLPAGAETIVALAAPSLDLPALAIDALAPDPIQLEQLDTTSSIAIAPITVAPIDITDVQRR